MQWLVVSVAILFSIYVAWLTTRLTRLHSRTYAAWGALKLALTGRARVAQNVAELLPGAIGERLHATAAAVLSGDDAQENAQEDSDRECRENELTRALRAAVNNVAGAPGVTGVSGAIKPDPAAGAVIGQAIAANRRLGVARQVYNDAVRDTLALRRARIPRALRLAEPHRRPAYFDIDTEL